MNEKELLLKCVISPHFATLRLINKYGYSLNQLQKIRDQS
jgi:hypothetical protein